MNTNGNFGFMNTVAPVNSENLALQMHNAEFFGVQDFGGFSATVGRDHLNRHFLVLTCDDDAQLHLVALTEFRIEMEDLVPLTSELVLLLLKGKKRIFSDDAGVNVFSAITISFGIDKYGRDFILVENNVSDFGNHLMLTGPFSKIRTLPTLGKTK